MPLRWGRSHKKNKEKKGLLYEKPPFAVSFVVISEKKGLQFGKPPFSAIYVYQIKNNTTLFLSILKLKNLSVVHFRKQIKQLPPCSPWLRACW